MPAYNAEQFAPPAPVAYVTLHPLGLDDPVTGVPMLMDTGADVTLLPREYIEQMGVKPIANKVYEIEGFDGEIKLAEAVQIELVFSGKKFKGQFLILEQPIGILGRNILNTISLLLDGPHETWEEQKG
ncbi:MAG: retroviral-like aspartic protease [Chloroflexi bacterium]|nr:retroviral-like aspartic protease [Chloroflexota bacterium]